MLGFIRNLLKQNCYRHIQVSPELSRRDSPSRLVSKPMIFKSAPSPLVASTVVASVCGVTSPVTSMPSAVLLDELLLGKVRGGNNPAVDD